MRGVCSVQDYDRIFASPIGPRIHPRYARRNEGLGVVFWALMMVGAAWGIAGIFSGIVMLGV